VAHLDQVEGALLEGVRVVVISEAVPPELFISSWFLAVLDGSGLAWVR
jgi:hypothetical protein